MTAARLLVLGASGDLTGRYLLPALAELVAAGALPDRLDVVGVSREPWDDARFRTHAAEQLGRHATDVPAAARRDLIGRLRHVAGDATDASVVGRSAAGAHGPIVVYLALPPAVFAPTISALAEASLPTDTTVVVEKPFGTDLASARSLNELLRRHVPEERVFRIDHFLGMQTVQNLLGLRFANRLFAPLWCAEHVERVDIVWDEVVALEGRAGYYDHTGALRDVVQNHLLQLLALVAMDRPRDLGSGSLRDAKARALRSVRPPDRNQAAECTRRARYTAGRISTRPVPDYAAEPGVDPGRATETFAEITLTLDDDRWRGVPFRLRTGKALAADRREIRVSFRPVEQLPFGQVHPPEPNVLTLTMDPDTLMVDLALNGAGDPFVLEPARLGLHLPPQELSAYARLLVDAIEGEPVLATRADEVEESWRIVEPVLAAWAEDQVPLEEYPAGSTVL